MALPPERDAHTRIDPAGYLAQFNVLPYLVAVADEVLDLGIEPITPAQLARAASHAIRKMPVHALEAAVVSMAMLGEGRRPHDAFMPKEVSSLSVVANCWGTCLFWI